MGGLTRDMIISKYGNGLKFYNGKYNFDEFLIGVVSHKEYNIVCYDKLKCIMYMMLKEKDNPEFTQELAETHLKIMSDDIGGPAFLMKKED